MEPRLAQTSDAHAVRSVLVESFGEEAAAIAEVLETLRAAGDLAVELVAGDGGDAVVGYVALSRAWLDARERLVEVLVLSPLGVLTSFRSRGIGTALLQAAVEAAEAMGSPLVFLEGDPSYYSARGWSPSSSHGIERPSSRVPDAACQVVLLPAHESWMTGRLIYPDVWWRLDLVGLRDPLLGEIEAGPGTAADPD